MRKLTLLLIMFLLVGLLPMPTHAQDPNAYPVVPTELKSKVYEIYAKGQELGNRPNVFSKIGDSITASSYFLTPVGNGRITWGDYAHLQSTVDYFKAARANNRNSFSNDSLAAKAGWTTADVLNSNLVYSPLCEVGESPLVCEYRIVKPAVALIMFGTNDIIGVGDAAAFKTNLDTIVLISQEHGVIPILSTIPDMLFDPAYQSRVMEYNTIIVSTASFFEIPLWNYWLAMQPLPNLGLSSDNLHPSAPGNGASANFTQLQFGYNVRNLTALQVLDLLHQAVLH